MGVVCGAVAEFLGQRSVIYYKKDEVLRMLRAKCAKPDGTATIEHVAEIIEHFQISMDTALQSLAAIALMTRKEIEETQGRLYSLPGFSDIVKSAFQNRRGHQDCGITQDALEIAAKGTDDESSSS